MRWRRILIALLSIALICGGGWRFWYQVTGGFTPQTVHAKLVYNPDRDVPKLSLEEMGQVRAILKQPFIYMGKGAQCFAFISRDGNHVLKLFKSKHHDLSLFDQFLEKVPLFSTYADNKRQKKKQRLDAIFLGYLFAYRELGETSGLTYLHLNNTEDLKQTVHIYDGFGMFWPMDLDNTIFVLQRYCKTLGDTLTEALSKKDLSIAHYRLKQIVDMYFSGYEKKLVDADHAICRNSGFAEELPIHLDLGHFASVEGADEAFLRADMGKVVLRITEWLDSTFPEYRDELIGSLKRYVEEKFSLAKERG
jgi:hypothetical protein